MKKFLLSFGLVLAGIAEGFENGQVIFRPEPHGGGGCTYYFTLLNQDTLSIKNPTGSTNSDHKFCIVRPGTYRIVCGGGMGGGQIDVYPAYYTDLHDTSLSSGNPNLFEYLQAAGAQVTDSIVGTFPMDPGRPDTIPGPWNEVNENDSITIVLSSSYPGYFLRTFSQYWQMKLLKVVPSKVEEKKEEINQKFDAYPNPFRFRVNFTAAASSILLYNNSGRLIRQVYRFWDGKDENGKEVPSGIYFCRVGRELGKIVKMK